MILGPDPENHSITDQDPDPWIQILMDQTGSGTGTLAKAKILIEEYVLFPFFHTKAFLKHSSSIQNKD